MENTQKRGQPRWKPLVGWAIGGLIAVFMIRWGGIPEIGAAFYLGVVVYLAITLTLGLTIWKLYRQPNAAAGGKRSQLSVELQQLLAVLLCISGFILVISLFWDELWHRRYGGVGQDFYWGPHLLLYGCILTFTGTAGFGMYRAWRQGGSLQERFRSEPALGLVGLISLFFIISIPSDEFWHRIYGEDITVWSLPHLTLLFGAAAILLGGVAIQRGLMAYTPWSRLRWLTYQEWIIVILLAAAYTLIIQVTVGEWDSQRQPFTEASPAFWNRPEWLYPVLILWASVLISCLALFAVRKAGTATIVIGSALLVRSILIAIIGNATGTSQMTIRSHLFCLISAVVLDGWMWWRNGKDGDALHRAAPLITAGVFFSIGLPLISAMMLYPRINLQTLPGIIGFGIPVAYLAAFIGTELGNWVHRFSHSETHAPILKRRTIVGTITALVITIVVIVIIVIITPPPVIRQSNMLQGRSVNFAHVHSHLSMSTS